ncbi:hypothetical protein FJZ31_29680 [Candidatus Poribacteria bacterium]|nr:hypothetical protein [Candidatus Poribacteria bacterium]
MRKCNSIPDFNSIDELMDFWDTHEFVDYLEDMEDVEFKVDLRRNRNYVRIDENIIKKIQQVAREKGIPYRRLINQWLNEKVAMS